MVRPELVGTLGAFAAPGQQVGVRLDVASCVGKHEVVTAAQRLEQMLCNVELVTVHDLFDLDGLPGGFGGPHLAATEIGCCRAVSAELKFEFLTVRG